MEDPFLTPEQKRAQRKADKAYKLKLAQDDRVIQQLMGSVAGRAWVREKMELCGIFRSTFSPGHSDITAFNEGQRNVGLNLLADLMRACPEAYVQMLRESNERPTESGPDRRDPDDERNYDAAGRWIGDGDGPEDTEWDR